MSFSAVSRMLLIACAAGGIVSLSAPSHAVNPIWFNATTGRGFQPHISDYYQHQKWGPNGSASGPAGQSETTWERRFSAGAWRWGGWCRIASFTDASYALKRAGYAGMMPDGATANITWLTTSNDEVRALATHTFTNGLGINAWVRSKGHGQSYLFFGLVYYYYVYFPDAWYNATPGAPANGFYYRSSDGSWKRLQVEVLPPPPPPLPPTYMPERLFDRFRLEFLGGNTVVLLLRTLPYVAGNFNPALWWRGSGGGNFHNVIASGIDVNNRRICFADPDSNKGNTIDRAGINIGASLDPPVPEPAVDGRKYKPWNGVGDGIPVPTPHPTQPNDPLFYDAYYNCVTIENDPESRRFSDIAANERYRNVVINQIEIIAPVIFARVLPPPPESTEGEPIPSISHVFGVTAGPIASTDEIWFFPVATIDWALPVTFSMPGWTVSQVTPAMTDPQGNFSSLGGLRLSRTSGSPIHPGDVAELAFSTTSPYDAVKYDVLYRDADDPQVYRPQVYGVEEGGVGLIAEQVATEPPPPGEPACLADATHDNVVDVNDLLLVIGSWGQIGVPGDFDGNGVDVNDLLTVIGAWGPCP